MRWRFHLIVLCCAASDLPYPTPPNPFAAVGTPSSQPPPPLGTALPDPQIPPPPAQLPSAPADLPTAPANLGAFGGGDSLSLGGDGDKLDAAGVPVPETPTPAATASPATAPIVPPKRRGGFRLRPALCLAGLAAACHYTRPREALLISALDAHQQELGHALMGGADMLLEDRGVPELIDAGLATLAPHGELLWLGLLGRWMPLLPLSAEGLNAWMQVVDAPVVLLLALTLGCPLGMLLGSHCSVSLHGLFRRGRVHTLLTSALSPVGLAHWLHAACVVVVASDGLGEALGGRQALLGWWLACGAASALSVSLSQAVLGRRSQPRSTVSGAAMGLLLMRAACLGAEEPLTAGHVSLPPLRAVLLHFVLDAASNALPPPGAIGLEKLLAYLGPALLVVAARPQARELVSGLAALLKDGQLDWRQMVAYARAAL